MFGLVARMLLLSSAAGTVYWTVNDAVQKKAADIKTLQEGAFELEEINKSFSIADERVKGNQSILAVVQQEFDGNKNASERSLLQLKEQNEQVDKLIKEMDAVKAKLQHSIAKGREASADEKQAKDALEASERALTAKIAEVQKANEAYANAKDHLEAVITGGDTNEIPSAYTDTEDYEKTLEAAQAELKAAEKSKADNFMTVIEKVALVQKREVEQQKKQTAFDDASAALRHAEEAQKNMRDKTRPDQLKVQDQSKSLEAQKRAVDHLTSERNRLHNILEQKQNQHDELQNTIVDDSHCIESLRSWQGQVQSAAQVYNATLHAYTVSHSDDLLEAVWGTKDALDKFTYDSYLTQKKCAPDTLHLSKMSAPPSCEKETGGTCSFLWCDASRHSYCDQATKTCRCPLAACATSSGECRSRGPPPTAALEEPAVPEQAETPARGNLKIFIIVFFAMLVGMAAAAALAVHKRSGSRNGGMLSESFLEE